MSEISHKRRFSDTVQNETSSSKKQNTGIVSTVSIADEETGLAKCFHRIRAKMYLSLAPCHLEHPILGLRQQHLDPLIMTYNSTVGGIIISYNNIKLSQDNYNNNEKNDTFKYVAQVSYENPFSFLWVYVDFVVWKPQVGDNLEGYSIMQSQSHIGLLIHDVFNASIKKFYIPQDWYFVANQADEPNADDNAADNDEPKSSFKKLGHWCDADGTPVGGKIKFTVRAIHVSGKGLAVEGTLLTPEMEKDSLPVVMEEQIKSNIKKHVKFDGEEVDDTVTTDSKATDVVVNDEIEEKEMKDAVSSIEPLQPEDEIAPVYNDDNSDSGFNSSSSDESDSDSGKDAGKKDANSSSSDSDGESGSDDDSSSGSDDKANDSSEEGDSSD